MYISKLDQLSIKLAKYHNVHIYASMAEILHALSAWEVSNCMAIKGHLVDLKQVAN